MEYVEGKPMVHSLSDFAATSELARVRRLLEYPPNAQKVNEEGETRYVKAPVSSLLNLQIILGNDSDYYKHLGYNEFTGETTWRGEPFTDHLETAINLQIAEKYRIKIATERLREVMVLVAREHAYHPVRDYLEGLTWDGVPRIDELLVRYTGAADMRINRAIARKWMLSCVARVMQPGCQVDTTLILAGAQGAGKSSFFRLLVPAEAWFSDTAMDLGTKDAFQSLQGVWIYEVAELSALRARDAETVKAFLTARVDRYRPPYGRNLVRSPRQCVMVGTTNESEFLDDPTGARRFWPVVVGTFDLGALAADRDQLWAEAFDVYMTEGAACRWHLDPEEAAELAERHAQHGRTDTWRDLLERHMTINGRGDGLPMATIMAEALGLEPKDQHRGNAMRVASLLASLGCEKHRPMRAGTREWRWRWDG